MKHYPIIVAVVLVAGMLWGCAHDGRVGATNQTQDRHLRRVQSLPLHMFNEVDLDRYLRHLHATEPSPTARVVHLARRNLGQPYKLYLLGEAPFETIDADPIYCLDQSDCVVFAEHVLAMAHTDNFRDFLRLLQRIRYKDGHISVTSRNHYTEADWNRNNTWLLRDITEDLGGEHVIRFSQKVNRQSFFQKRYKIEHPVPVQTIDESFIPAEMVSSIKSQLRDGDVVNFVSGRNGSYWVGHVGLIGIAPDGSVNLIHSTRPRVREESIDGYMARQLGRREQRLGEGKSAFYGFKFLRPNADALQQLAKIDGPDAPRVTVPADSPITFEQYLDSISLGR